MQCWQQTAFSHEGARKPFSTVDEPLDFSVKSPGSLGGSDRDFGSPHHQDLFTSRSSKSRGSSGSLVKDEQYWQRREKNNAAAKRSRDARRQKEEATKYENQRLREENDQLRTTVRTLQEHVQSCPNAPKGGGLFHER